jgi:AcrR family transcriptional regulator
VSPPPPPQPPLSRDRVLDAAIRVADRGGVATITMRRVAQELGVEAMSLYHHVPNKDAILDALEARRGQCSRYRHVELTFHHGSGREVAVLLG